MVDRAYNFSAGPCTLPLPVLENTQRQLVDYNGSGMSLIEVSHRSAAYDEVHQNARSKALALWNAPDEFDVLFIQGGATGQFAMLPMNLIAHTQQQGAYIHSGHWADGAIKDAHSVGNAYTAWSGESSQFNRMPNADELNLSDNTRYLHVTSNETISGARFEHLPDTGIPLVADMSSEMLAREIPWHLLDVVYGGAQKNLAPAGVTLVYIRKSILEQCNTQLPRYLRYDLHQSKGSLFNTPPVFPIWVMSQVLDWMEAEGGLAEMQQRAAQRSNAVYNAMDQSGGFFSSPIETSSRSHMNVVFHLPSERLEQQFIAQAAQRQLVNLKGHRSIGGIRASLYNAMPLQGALELAEFMNQFCKEYG